MSSNFELVSALNAGNLDPSFGSGGTVGFPGLQGQCRAVAKDQQDRLIVAVWANKACEVFRLDQNGTVDRSFGMNGSVLVEFEAGFDSRVNRILIQPDGKILLAGVRFQLNLSKGLPALARLDDKGNPDHQFGVDGKVVFKGRPGAEYSIFLGEIDVVSGAPGELLMTFPYVDIVGGIGTGTTLLLTVNDVTGELVRTHPVQYRGLNTVINSIARLKSGKLIAGGYVTLSSGEDRILLNRYDTDGWPDLNFGEYGSIVYGPLPGYYKASKVLLQADAVDQGILVMGSYQNQDPLPHWSALVMRFTENGQPDGSFNKGEPALVDAEQQTDWAAGALQQNKAIVMAGTAGLPGVAQALILGRVLEDGTFDKTFADKGWVIGPGGSGASGLDIQDNGRLVIAGNEMAARFLPKVFGYQS